MIGVVEVVHGALESNRSERLNRFFAALEPLGERIAFFKQSTSFQHIIDLLPFVCVVNAKAQARVLRRAEDGFDAAEAVVASSASLVRIRSVPNGSARSSVMMSTRSSGIFSASIQYSGRLAA